MRAHAPKITMKPLPIMLACASGLAVLLSADATAQFTSRTVALTGEQAPGFAPGVVFSQVVYDISPPASLNDLGDSAFRGTISGEGITAEDDGGIWVFRDGELSLIARENDQAPGAAPGMLYSGFTTTPPFIDNTGTITFRASLRGLGVSAANDRGIWTDSLDEGTLLRAWEARPAPGFGPETVYASTSFNSTLPTLDGAGSVVFTGFASGAGVGTANDAGLWAMRNGVTQLIAREGSPAAGAAGANYASFTTLFQNATTTSWSYAPMRIAFFGTLTGAGVNTTNNSGIWVEDANGLQILVRNGDPAPGTQPGVVFDLNAPMRFEVTDGMGNIAFVSQISGPGVTTSNRIGLWTNSGGALQLIARYGDAVPGEADGVTYAFLFGHTLNDSGELVVRGEVTGPGINVTNGDRIWRFSNGIPEAVVRNGDQAAGAPEGIRYGNFRAPVINNAGQIAFSGMVEGAGVDADNDLAVWATTLDGKIHLIAREGDSLDVSDIPGSPDLRVIQRITQTGGALQDFRFNQAGQVLLNLRFTDGSEGIFIFDTRDSPPAVPGDTNGDGVVNFADLNVVLSAFGGEGEPGMLPGDTNEDGVVNFADLNLVLSNFGMSGSE